LSGEEQIMAEEKVGVVTHYFGKIDVAGVEITQGELRVGDTIHVRGHTSDFTQQVEALQIEHLAVEVARAGDAVGVKVVDRAREHDEVFKVTED
jgi:translation initiation factor IF-2